MSLFSDVATYLGPGSVPVIVGGFVYGVFELGETLTSPHAKAALTHWLQTAEADKIVALPEYTMAIFQRIFGERHFSLKCLWRSAVFTVGSMAIIFGLIELVTNAEVLKQLIAPSLTVMIISLVLSWFPWSIIMDYISLYKTRLVLRWLVGNAPRIPTLSVVLFADFFAYALILFVGLQYFAIVISLEVGVSLGWDYLDLIPNQLRLSIGLPFDYSNALGMTAFWAGFVPSAWLWLYVASLLLTRSILKSEKLLNWLRWALDVDKSPFRSLGAVAAVLAFVGTAVVLILAKVV